MKNAAAKDKYKHELNILLTGKKNIYVEVL